MDTTKYELLKKAMLTYLNSSAGATHTELLAGIKEDFKDNDTKFEGALGWHMEWAKLHLIATKEIIKKESNAMVKLYPVTN